MIILTMLGTGNYGEVVYRWEGRQAKPHQFVQNALAEWFPDAQMLVCVTKEAREKHEGAIASIPRTRLVDIPSGKNEAEYWEIFNRIEQEIPEESELVLDITHGFRSLPILALLAVSFLRAAKRVRVKHVLYGAYDASQDGCTPVFDLVPFMSMLDWANATNRFLETGDASKFRPLVETRGAKPLNTHLNSAVRELDGLSEALSTNRAMRVGELSTKALTKIEQAENGEWEPSHAPLKLLLPRLKQGLHLLARDANASPQDQLIQLYGQVEWFLRYRQYEKAAGIAREWMVSFAQMRRQGSWKPIEYKNREEVEKWLNGCAKGEIPPPDEWKAFIGVWQDFGNLRNDLMHFGFRNAARSEKSIPEEVSEKIKQLKNVVGSMDLELPEVL